MEKINERNNNEIVTKYEGALKEIKAKGDEKIQDNVIKINELQENRNNMDATEKERRLFLEMVANQKEACQKKIKEIQDQKYQNQIALAKKK